MSNCCIHRTFLSESLKGHSYTGKILSLQHYGLCVLRGRGKFVSCDDLCNTQSDTEPFHLLFMSKGQSKGNCCGGHEDTEKENSIEPLPKHPHKRSNKLLGFSVTVLFEGRYLS